MTGHMHKTFDMGKKKAPIPKLDFSTLKHNKEYKDWYKYSTKLELSVKSLRARIKVLEDDHEACNTKNKNLRHQNSNLYQLNKKLLANIKDLKAKIVELRERYNRRVQRAKQFGVNELEMTIPRLETDGTDEYRQSHCEMDFEDYKSNNSYDGTSSYPKGRLHTLNTVGDSEKIVPQDLESGVPSKKLSSNSILELNGFLSPGKQMFDSSNPYGNGNNIQEEQVDKILTKPVAETTKDEFKIQMPTNSLTKGKLMSRIQQNDQKYLAGGRIKHGRKINDLKLDRLNSVE